MKCVKDNTGKVKRVSEDRAIKMVGEGWNYCPKSEWKSQERITITVEKTRDGKTTSETSVLQEGKSNVKIKKSGKNKGDVK